MTDDAQPGPLAAEPERRLATERMTEEQVARHFGQSPSAFSHLADLRSARASNLLLTHDSPVQQVARFAGVGTVASLNRHFRAITRTTPSAYRSKARTLNTGLRAAEGQLLRCTPSGERPRD